MMQNQAEGLSKRAQIEVLLCLEGDNTISHGEIAEQVGVSVGYVHNISHDKKSNGNFTKAWRKKFPEKRNEQQRRNFKIGRKFDFHRCCRYTGEEERMILGGFEGTDRELAKKIHRSVHAIQIKRYVLKNKP